ncbi:putative glycerophosphodiester phosphodiesterase, protein kinase RLK-Pelle-LRK10L-2 family [Medicago truncatula]|uniref:Putative glycerophosphodiester phosphodiesterase, protein kinase RLK-Pelle-LRK10L-2 family n=1 Tax=Medicago truncatula TaxID=3880 RepID=A0A072VE96_MEDTR|nr:rust resistance kinase Lr10 [Medicago truncatula]KEH40329.1 receptor-like kinase [Medicago truncatula]RHN77744.1 putative glycerophosphodiester phosphodiesterase, protein kinase RLK-Pelle-LRK10L-2 family [Medicago truncatula]
MAETHTTLIMQLLMILLIKSGNAHDQCRESYCGPNQPLIKFPFQIVKESSQDQCVYPKEFCLYCTENKKTMIVLSTSSGPIKFHVSDIDYESHSMSISDPDNCLPKKFLILNNSSFRPYRFDSELDIKIFFFNCFSVRKQHLRNQYQTSQESQDMITCPIYVADSDEDIVDLDLLSCTKMFDVNASMMGSDLRYNFLRLSWPKQSCAKCESKGMKCKWMNNTTKPGIECFYCNQKHKKFQPPKALIFSAIGSIILGMGTIVFIKIYLHFREKEEDQVRIDKFLEDYRAQKPARFSYSDIKRITSGFKEKLGEGAHGSVFKGKLSSEILVAVKILNNTQGEGKEFITEVEIMGKIHHINVVRLLGFCAEGVHCALVYNFFSKGSLQSFIFPPDNKDYFMGWEKLQQISTGIAKAIEYLHEGCSHPIIHFDINPRNVLLDDSFTPKISDFGLAKLCAKNLSIVSMTAARGTLGYMAPEVVSRNFGNVSLKSDIYSYGMLLLEMVGGRKNVDSSSAEDLHVLYPEWIHNLLEGDIHINVEDEVGNAKIARKLAIVGLWCIQWQPMNRPSIKTVIQMLETEDDSQLTFPPNPFHSTNSITSSEGSLPRRPLKMEAIQE